MAKDTVFQCSACSWQVSKWVGQCPSCKEWGTLEEVPVLPHMKATSATSKSGKRSTSAVSVAGNVLRSSAQGLVASHAAQPITGISATASQAIRTGISELDRVLGTGIVPGSVVLLAGEPGVGKSTLLLEVAYRCATSDLGPTLYVTGEESVGQVRLRAERTGALSDKLLLAAETDIGAIISQTLTTRPGLLVVDSVQTMQAADIEGTRGGVAQARAVTAALTSLAKETGTAVFLVGHVTKDGNVAGPRTMEHLVDVVLNFEGDRHSGLRFLRGLKNRFGTTDEVGCFEQTSEGIREVTDPSGLFLHHRTPAPGTAITVAMDGRRPLLAEVQGLVVDSEAHNPRRNVSGLDVRRVPMIAAVLTEHGRLKSLPKKELYVSTVGGMSLQEPSADLAVALAVASSTSKRTVRDKMVVLGELGLAGELRRVPDMKRRLREAQRMGFRSALVPQGSTGPAGMKLLEARHIGEALQLGLTMDD